MASQSYDPQTDWRQCFSARFIPLDTITNADMDGIAVGFAAVVVNLCLRIQMSWPSEGVDAGVIASIAQLYCILLSTLFSINRQQLSLFDANYALTVTSSPFTIYLVFSSIRELLGYETGLFERLESHPRVIRFFGALLLPVWLGLRITLLLSGKAFKDSQLCDNTTFSDFLMDLFLLFLPQVGLTGGAWVAVVAFFTINFLLLIVDGCTTGFDTSPIRADNSWLSASVDYQKILYLVILDSYWVASLITSAFLASGNEYVMSYGQLLTLFATVPPLFSTVRLICAQWKTRETSFFILILIAIGACCTALLTRSFENQSRAAFPHRNITDVVGQ